MKQIRDLFLMTVLIAGLQACTESTMFQVNSDDTNPPGVPVFLRYNPLPGGVTLYYDFPSDNDLLRIEAAYTTAQNETFHFTASYFVDSLRVYGFADSTEYTVQLYAVDRAGNRSASVPVTVVPLKPAIREVAQSVVVKPGFSAFYVDWKNEQQQTVHIHVDYSFQLDGKPRKLTSVFTSMKAEDRRFINDLTLESGQSVHVQVRVADIYGNIIQAGAEEDVVVWSDVEIPKSGWRLPLTNDTIGGEPMFQGHKFESRDAYLIDGIIDEGELKNYTTAYGNIRTGKTGDGELPFNIIIDLGDSYELSRIVTHQRYDANLNNAAATPPGSRGMYYLGDNIRHYNMYILDEATDTWELLSDNTIFPPNVLNTVEIIKLGKAGDMAYMYPDAPRFTRPARWFRYEVDTPSFSGGLGFCLSEITLYGKKK
ncbi:hypothetical protein AGMMS49982_07000 [Bacteroidia bacterium]|nr:hypothetical protein AGMMS49982_07000 [Bacteroidia bacterium]